jgi:hypothetical protein
MESTKASIRQRTIPDVGLQEMLMQTIGRKIRLFPAWPKDWDVDFKLHAPYNTVVEGRLKDGEFTLVNVTPPEREKDIVFTEPGKPERE